MLPLEDGVDLGVMAMTVYSIFPRAPGMLSLVNLLGDGVSAEMQSVYSTAPGNWALIGQELFCGKLRPNTFLNR